jgi:hypothetical protein
MVARYRRKRNLRNWDCFGGEIWANKHRYLAKWAYLGGGWNTDKRNKLSRILSERGQVDGDYWRKYNDNKRPDHRICTR